MPDTDVIADAAEVTGAPPEPVNCRHCGQPIDVAPDADPAAELQCPACERYQDTISCPTCHQPARISLLPADVVPAPHAPARRRG